MMTLSDVSRISEFLFHEKRIPIISYLLPGEDLQSQTPRWLHMSFLEK